jgi:alpha-amylase
MPKICLYFQLHQPYRLRELEVFELGSAAVSGKQYFAHNESDDNREIFCKVAQKSYIPMLTVLCELIEHEPRFTFALSTSGVFLEQAQQYEPRVIELLQRLARSQRVEFLAETYYHSLASLYSQAEFFAQVRQHEQLLFELFGVRPTVFRNTELIYSNHIGWLVAQLGYTAVLTEAVPRYLGGRPKTTVYRSHTDEPIPLLLKHAELSDDIAFRFSNKGWHGYPLTAEKYLDWVEVYREDELINLFMDFETFGEHQWADTGIFDFFRHFVAHFNSRKWNSFVTPSQVVAQLHEKNAAPTHRLSRYFSRQPQLVTLQTWLGSTFGTLLEKIASKHQDHKQAQVQQLPVYDVPEPISWADVDRDLTAWRDNALQHDSLRVIYELSSQVLQSNDRQLIEDWRRLQTSDHFYYMCTKWAADGDVHAYFSPYSSPHEAYRRYAIALADLQERLL